jgi:hypothetical protein
LEQNWPRHQTDQKKQQPKPGKHAPTSTPERSPSTQRNAPLAGERFPKEDNRHPSKTVQTCKTIEKTTRASTDKTASVEISPNLAPVSTNQTGNPRCKALPINKDPKARLKKKRHVHKNPFNKKTVNQRRKTILQTTNQLPANPIRPTGHLQSVPPMRKNSRTQTQNQHRWPRNKSPTTAVNPNKPTLQQPSQTRKDWEKQIISPLGCRRRPKRKNLY